MPSVPSVTRSTNLFVQILLALLLCLLTAVAIVSRSLETIHLWACPSDSPRSHSYEIYKPAPPPRVVFWAWERPEDFRFLTANDVGVAFLAKTILLPPPTKDPIKAAGRSSFFVRPRLQPLRVLPGTPLIAVVRLEAPRGRRFSAYTTTKGSAAASLPDSVSDRERIALEIAELQSLPGVRAIQIDYDATLSEREFYASLLSEVRRKLPPAVPLSITALASWCIGDTWLERLPPGTIQEAVPMLFRMGPDSSNVAKFLRSGQDFPVAACQGSLGVSVDESVSHDMLSGKLPGVSLSWRRKRIYIFPPRPWTAAAADSILKEWQP